MRCSVSRGAAHEVIIIATPRERACRPTILNLPMSILPALKSEEFFRSCGGRASDFFQRNTASSRDFFRDQPRVRRLGAFSAKRDRRQIRTISFDHEFIERHPSSDFTHLFPVFERDDSGKGDEVAKISDFIRLIQCSAKTMKYAADLPAVIAQNFQGIVPGVALMNHDVEP